MPCLPPDILAAALLLLCCLQTSLTYMAVYIYGSLAGGALNSAGISCSAQYVSPLKPLIPGASRIFVEAQLVSARSLQEVVEKAAYPGAVRLQQKQQQAAAAS